MEAFFSLVLLAVLGFVIYTQLKKKQAHKKSVLSGGGGGGRPDNSFDTHLE